MQITAISDFEKDMNSYINKVANGSETLIIDIGKGSGVIVLSLDEYNQLKAAQHELSLIKKKKKT
ncbi:MAG: prevent-host-death protein [Bacteroidetes bacterium]|nr:MAG: prevent-host-death protein [Bacteroidota bacterium]